jgi:uncharacterized protein with GYD domain
MAKYTILADRVDGDTQNIQEWAKTWGEIENDVRELDGELHDAYAVLGDHDFQFTYEAANEEAAMKIAVAIERHGLDTRTHQLIEIDELGELVDDI